MICKLYSNKTVNFLFFSSLSSSHIFPKWLIPPHSLCQFKCHFLREALLDPTPNRLTSNHIIDSQQDRFTAGGWWEGRWFREMDFERLWSFGILKDGGEEGVSLSEKWKWKLHSHVWLFVRPHTVHGILQARILEWVAFPCSRRSSQTRDRTQVSNIAGRFFTIWVTREVVCQKRGGRFHSSGRWRPAWLLSWNQPNLIPELLLVYIFNVAISDNW